MLRRCVECGKRIKLSARAHMLFFGLEMFVVVSDGEAVCGACAERRRSLILCIYNKTKELQGLLRENEEVCDES